MSCKGQKGFKTFAVLVALLGLSSCASVGVPDARNVNIPSPNMAEQRQPAINERPDSVMYLPLGEDVLVPEVEDGDSFPNEEVGPFELRGETLAGALQLILADYDISLAFETQEGLTRRITVANLRGDLGQVVHQVCSLANLYCSYENGTIIIKDSQTFTVTLPPLGGTEGATFLEDISAGLGAILNSGAGSSGTSSTPIVDQTTRTLVYSATQRTADIAARYFQRLRANTAMIVFETYIWEVSLNTGNSTGVDWFKLASFGKFNTGISIDGGVGADFTSPISIGLPTTSGDFNGTSGDLVQFLSQFGAVKTISQPQITVLSGSEAELRVADTRNYVSQIATTLSEGQATTSVNTDSVDTGFTLTIGSSWDKSTVYANVAIELTDVKQIDDFAFSDDDGGGGAAGTQTRIQLPQTSERQLTTQIRVRPGDSVLIAGLVRENDNFDEEGPGFMEPIVPQSRTAQAENLELVIMLRPRVIVYTASNDKRYVDFANKKHKLPGTGVEEVSRQPAEPKYGNRYTPLNQPVVPEQEIVPAGMPAPLTPEPVSSPLSAAEPVPALKPAVTPAAPAPVQRSYVSPVVPLAPAPVISPPVTPPPVVPVVSAPVVSAPPAPVLSTVTQGPLTPDPADSGRFRRGSGFASSGVAPVSPRPGASVYPAEDYYPAQAVTPSYAPVSSAPSNTQGAVPAYETYDEYTSSP